MAKKFKGRLGSKGATPDGPTRRFKGDRLKKNPKVKKSDSQVSGRKGVRRMAQETKAGVRAHQMSVHNKGGKPTRFSQGKSQFKITAQPRETAGGPSKAKHRKK